MNPIHPSLHRRSLRTGAGLSLVFLLLWAVPPADLRAEEAVPVIESLDPAEGEAGTVVTIRGRHFGPRVGALQGTSGVSFNGVWVTPSHWSEGEIRAVAPPGAASGPVVVSVAGEASDGAPFSVTGPGASDPAIATVSPGLGPAGTVVTIRGANFQAAQGMSTVTFNGVEATPTNWQGKRIEVAVPAGATTGPVVVTVGGQASNGISFKVIAAGPAIKKVTPFSGPVGTVVTVRGNNFQSSQGASTVTFNGVEASPTSWKGKRIEVAVTEGATSGPVVVTVDGQESNGIPFTVEEREPEIY